jgi:RHS repeat-associated protein
MNQDPVHDITIWEYIPDSSGAINIWLSDAPYNDNWGNMYYRVYEKSLPADQNLSPSGACFCSAANAKYWVGKPIDAKTGNYSYQITDLRIGGALFDLKFERSYASALREESINLGNGWRHNYDIRLTINADHAIVQMGDGSRLRFYQVLAYPTPNDPHMGYMAFPGIFADLKFVTYNDTNTTNDRYELKTVEDLTYIFYTNGLLEKIQDENQHTLSFTYNSASKLTQVTDDTSQKSLQLEYYPGTSRIQSVKQIGSSPDDKVQFTYSSSGNLGSVVDPNGKTWPYFYEAANPKLLTKVQDPLGHTLERTEFDAVSRAVRQYDGTGVLTTEIFYYADYSLVKDASGRETRVVFDGRNTLSRLEFADGSIEQRVVAGNYRPNVMIDGNGHTTAIEWHDSNCTNPFKVTDAMGGVTKLGIEDPDHPERNIPPYINGKPTVVTDALGHITTFGHNGDHTLIDSKTDALGHKTTYQYTPAKLIESVKEYVTVPASPLQRTTTYTYTSAGLINTITDPAGRITQYEYTATGALKSITEPGGRKTVYNGQGRVKTISVIPDNTTNAQRVSWLCYDNAGRFTRQVDRNGMFADAELDCSTFVPQAGDQIRSTVYDDAGNPIASIAADGVITRTYYDAANRPMSVVRNLQGQAISANNPPQPTRPDQNLRTDTVYDANGNPIATIAVVPGCAVTRSMVNGKSVVTTTALCGVDRTYYDKLNRPEFVVRNLAGQQIGIETPPGNALRGAEQNLTTQTVYDLSGLTIAAIQLLKDCTVTPGYDAQNKLISLIPSSTCLVNRTWHDALGRPISQVQNWKGTNLFTGTPPVPDALYPDRNLRTDTVYDAGGNAIATINVLPGCQVTRTSDATGKLTGVTVTSACVVDRTYSDALNRPEFVVRNLTGRVIFQEVSWNVQNRPDLLDLTRNSDQNLITQTIYNGIGQTIATLQILPGCIVTRGQNSGHATYTTEGDCRVNRTYYDSQGRVTVSVQNLSEAVDEDDSTPPAYDPSVPDRNVPSGRLSGQTLYDSSGRGIASIDRRGVITRTWYDVLGQTTAVTRNLRDPARDTLIDPVELVKLTTPPAYDAANPDRADWNVTTQTRYDPYGRAIASIDPQNHVTRTWYDALGRAMRVVQNLRDPNNANASIEQLVALSAAPAYDPAHPDWNISREMVYDAQGRTIATISAASAGCVVTRAADGTVTVTSACIVERSYFDTLGRVYATVRNLTGQAVTQPYPPTSDRAEKTNLITYTIYDARGQAIAMTTPHKDCVVTRTEVNNLTVVAVNASCTVQRSYYDELGRVVTTVQNLIGQDYTVLTPPARNANQPNQNVRTDTRYDSRGQRFESVDPKGIVTRFEYDQQSRLMAVTENYLSGVTPDHQVNVRTVYSYNALGQRLTLQNALGKITTFQYDRLGRLTSERNPLNQGSSYQYDTDPAHTRDCTSQIDGLNQTTRRCSDALGRLTQIDYPGDPDVTFRYDANSQRIRMSDSTGTTLWAYDGLGRIQSVTDPSNKVVSYAYNGLGAQTRLTYPDQKTVQYGYTPLGELETVTDWNNAITRYHTVYTTGGGWQRVTAQPNGTTTRAEYTTLGRLSKLTHTTPAFVVGYAYGYDLNGNRQWAEESFAYRQMVPLVITDGSGGSFLSAPNPGSSTATPAPRSAPRRNPTPTPTLPAYPAPAPQSAPRGSVAPTPTVPAYPAPVSQVEPQKSLWQQVVDFLFGDHTPVVSAHSAPSANAIPGAPGALRIDYVYDPLNRLTGATHSSGSSFGYAYNAIGNRTQETTGTISVDSQYDDAGRLTKVGSVNYTWNANGNLLNDGLHAYTYDNANRLKTAIGGGVSASFTYNGLGERLSQTVNNATTTYTLDISGSLSQVLQTNTQTYLYGDARIAQTGAGGMEYFLPDAMGSVRQIVAANGVLLMNQSYTPYGKVLNGQSTTHSIYGFDGEQTDSTGLQYLRARYYSPATGSFISKDTWEGDALAPMSYVPWLFGYANPVMNVDPSGRIPVDCGDQDEDCRLARPDPAKTQAYLKEYTKKYNEKVPPPGITFTGRDLARIQVNTYASGKAEDNSNVNGAQIITLQGGTKPVPGLCGHLSLAAILGLSSDEILKYFFEAYPAITIKNEDGSETTYPKGTANRPKLVNSIWVSDYVDLTTSTTLEELQTILSEYNSKEHEPRFYAKIESFNADGWGQSLRNYLQAGYSVICGITIDGNTGRLQNSAVGEQFYYANTEEKYKFTEHWIVITGISDTWVYDDGWMYKPRDRNRISPMNWLRIYNPYDNETEYYWWGDLQAPTKGRDINLGYRALVIR